MRGVTDRQAGLHMMVWKYAKLAEDKKKPEVDWSKIEVDTSVLVKNKENNE